MPRKTANDHQANTRLGDLAEALVRAFLLEYCDFAYPTQDKHPADLLCELGPAKYTIQVKARNKTPENKFVFATENSRNQSEIYKHYHCDIIAFVFMPNKRILFKPNTSSQNYFTFEEKIIVPDLEIKSFTETLETLSEIPVIRPLFK